MGATPGRPAADHQVVSKIVLQMLGSSGVRHLHSTRFVHGCMSQMAAFSGRCLTSMPPCTTADSLLADTGCSRPCSSTSSAGSDDGSCREMLEHDFSAQMGGTLPCLKWQLQRDFGAQWRHVSVVTPPLRLCQLQELWQLLPMSPLLTKALAQLSCLAHCCSYKPHIAVFMLASLLRLEGPIQLSCLAQCRSWAPPRMI